MRRLVSNTPPILQLAETVEGSIRNSSLRDIDENRSVAGFRDVGSPLGQRIVPGNIQAGLDAAFMGKVSRSQGMRRASRPHTLSRDLQRVGTGFSPR